MKRSSYAAIALLLSAAALAATQSGPAFGQAAPQTDVGNAFTSFRQNAIDMGLKGDMAGVKTLYEATIDPAFKGQHNVTLALRPTAGDMDMGAMAGKPGEMVISSPVISFNFAVATTKGGYVELINGLQRFTGPQSPVDAQIALPAVLKNTTLKAEVQAVEMGADGTTATVKNTVTGTINSENIAKELGYPGLPPMLGGLDLNVKMDCTTALKLDGKGGFTVTGETCSGGLEGVAKPNLPGPAPKPTMGPK